MTAPAPTPVPLPKSPWRSTWRHLALLVLALAGAWLSFERPFGDAGGAAGAAGTAGTVVVQAAEDEVERVAYERGERRIEIEVREDDLGRWFAGREGADTVFVGGRQVETVWRGLAPLRAVRVLENVDDAKLAELGLADDDSAAEFLRLTVRGRDIGFRVGGRPFGGADRYARRETGPGAGDAPGGTVLVLPSEVASGLAGGAALLMERRLFAASRPEVEAMTLQRPGAGTGAPLRIRQRPGVGPAEAHWTVETSDDADADLAAWVDKFFRLSAVAYRPGSPDPGWRPEAVVTVESRTHGSSTLEIWSAVAEEDRAWLARSPFTRLIVELSASLAEDVCADLDGLDWS